VTKATCGDSKVAQAMLDSGCVGIADSRIPNIKDMSEKGVKTEFMLLRTPMLSEISDVIKHSDISLNSEIKVIEKLSEEAKIQNRIHKIILMVEMGDLREGIAIENLDQIILRCKKLEGIELYGIGMNLACFGGVVPTKEKIDDFCKLVKLTEEKHDIKFNLISGGNSANIPYIIDNPEKTRINNLRIGEAILLGLETVHRTAIKDTYQDAFILEAEIIELKIKESKPFGKITQNAFGETIEYKDIGKINRAIIAVGNQDTIPQDLVPLDNDIEILGSSSDHVILRLKNNSYKLGDKIRFKLKYGALVNLFTSKYVKKEFV